MKRPAQKSPEASTVKKNRPGTFVSGDPRACHDKRNSLPREIRNIRNLTTVEFIDNFNDLLQKTHSQLHDIYTHPDTPILRAYLARCLLFGKMRGDYYTLNLMLDRIIGKVKEMSSVEMSGPNGGPIITKGANSELVGFTKDELRKLLRVVGTKENVNTDTNWRGVPSVKGYP